MDKLKPILQQQFWIILGVGVILTFTGWWMATGSLAAAIDTRKSAIKSAEEGIPSGVLPNESWSRQLSEINVQQEAMVEAVRRQMWEQQAETMFWPENVQDFAAELPYRGDFNLVARNLYRSSYVFTVEQVWKLVRPVDLDGSGIVLFPMEKMPIKKSILGDLAPSSSVIWDAQEDLWLTVPILQAIREVNGGENSNRADASIHVIEKFELLGGERTTGESSSSSSGGMSEAGADMGMLGGMMGGGGSGRNTDGKAQSADFSPEEEFGSSGRENASGGGGGGNMMSAMADMSMESGDGGDTGGTKEVRRYVDDDESAPFKTRAFYLSVVMDHRKVPHFLAELTASGNSPWPMEIVRVQMSRVNPDDAEGRNLGGNLMAGVMNAGPESEAGNLFAGEAGGIDEGGGGPINISSLRAGAPGQLNPAKPQLSLEAVLQDPFTARVAIAGLIYLYRPVDPPAATEGSSAEPTDAVAEAPAEGTPTDGTMPAEGTPTPENGVEPVADPATTPPAKDLPTTNPAVVDPAAVPVPNPGPTNNTPPAEAPPPTSAADAASNPSVPASPDPES